MVLFLDDNNYIIRKKGFKYYCELCDFGVLSKSLYDKHIETITHKNILNIIKSCHLK